MDTEALVKIGQNALFNTYNRGEKVLISGHGTYVKDKAGHTYLDFVSGIATNILGHTHPKIVDTLSYQSQVLMHTSNSFWNEPSILLAEKLTTYEGSGDLQKVFFTNSGTEANEGAMKLARKFGRDNNGPNCTKIVSLIDSFHGRSMASLSATGQSDMHKNFKPLMPGHTYVEINNVEQLYNAVDNETCAVMVEVIQGEGGIQPISEVFAEALTELQNTKNILLIIDEVQTGMARTGTLFAHEQFKLKPDIISLAKGLGGGFPIGAFLASDQVAATFGPGDHGTTLGGNPLASAVSLTIIEEIFETNLLDNVLTRSNELIAGLEKLEGIKNIRGLGLLIGVELEAHIQASDLIAEAYEEGLLLIGAKHNVVRFLPPLNVSDSEVQEGLQKFKIAMEKILEKLKD